MKTLKLESKMNKNPSQSIDQAISALVDHNIKKSFKASDTNDDNNFDPLNLTIESAMALLDRHYRLDKSAYISIRSKLKDKIVKNGIRQSKILYKEADKEFNRLVGRAPVRYVAPRPARLSPIESAQASVRSLRETESKLRISLSHLKPGTSEYNDAHEHLVRILSQLKAAENPLSAFYEGYAFGSQDLEGSQPKNESDSARRSRLEGIFPSLKKRVEAEQLNFFHLVGLIANAEKRIQRLQDLYHHGHGDDKALIQENNSLVERLHVLLVNYQNSMREMPGHIKRLNEVAKALNEYYQDDEDHENPGLDWGLIALNDFIKLGSDGKIKSPGQLALRFGNLIGDISQLPTVIASLPNLKIREMSNALSQGLTGEPIADSIYQDPIVQATQQVGVMGAYLIPGVGEVLSLASLLSLKQAMERDPIGTFREVYDSFNPLANKIHDPETGNLRGATPADRIVRGLNLLMLAVGAYHLKGGLTIDGLATALGHEYHISFAEGKKFVEDLNADLLKVRVEEEARQQLKANAKKGNFKSVDDYLDAHPNALKKTIAEIEKSPNLMKKLSLPGQIEQLGNAKGVKERIERARNAPPGRGSDGENRLGGAVSTMGGNGPVGGEGLTGAGGTPTSKSTKSAASSVVQGPKSGSGVAVAVRGTETAKAQGVSSTAEASANKKAGPFERVWVEEAGTNAINGGSVPKFDVSAIQDGGTWLHASPFRKSSPFELPQPNGKPSGITFELGKDGHNLTLSDGSSFTITKPLWQNFLEQGTQPFGASLFGIGRGFTNPGQSGANSQSLSLGTPSDVRRFSELGDPTKSGSGSGQPAAAGGASANGQAGTAVQPQATSGAVASSGPAATPKSGLDKDAAVALIGGNQGGAGQSTTIGDPTTNPTSPPPTDPTTPAKPGVQGINEMETPKGYIFDISHPGWQQRTLQHIRQIEEGIKSGFYNSSIAPMMQNHLELLKRSLSTGVPLNEVTDEYSDADVERNINTYRSKIGKEPLLKGTRYAQRQYLEKLKEQMVGATPGEREGYQKIIDEILDYRRRGEIDPYTEKILNPQKEAPPKAGLFIDGSVKQDPHFLSEEDIEALRDASGKLWATFSFGDSTGIHDYVTDYGTRSPQFGGFGQYYKPEFGGLTAWANKSRAIAQKEAVPGPKFIATLDGNNMLNSPAAVEKYFREIRDMIDHGGENEDDLIRRLQGFLEGTIFKVGQATVSPGDLISLEDWKYVVGKNFSNGAKFKDALLDPRSVNEFGLYDIRKVRDKMVDPFLAEHSRGQVAGLLDMTGQVGLGSDFGIAEHGGFRWQQGGKSKGYGPGEAMVLDLLARQFSEYMKESQERYNNFLELTPQQQIQFMEKCREIKKTKGAAGVSQYKKMMNLQSVAPSPSHVLFWVAQARGRRWEIDENGLWKLLNKGKS